MKTSLTEGALRPGRAALSIFAACAAAAVLVAAASLPNGFVYDDVWIIESNETIHQLDFGELLTAPFWPEERGNVMWRPVALTAFALQWTIGDGTPLVFHLGSTILYGLVAGMAGLLCARLFGPALGLVAGLLFAVHPVHVEVSANVVGQTELWSALGYIAALLAAWERSGSSSPRWRSLLLLLSLGSLMLGLGGKEQPVTLPGAIVVLWWLRARSGGLSVYDVAKREWHTQVLSCAVIAAFLLLRAEFGGGVVAAGGIATGLDPESVTNRIVTMLPVTLTWLRVLFVPLALSADYSPLHIVPETTFGANHVIALLLWMCLFALTYLLRDRLRALVVGVALFVVTISVVSNVVVPLEVLMAERLLLLPSLGWALAVAAGMQVVYENAVRPAQRRRMLAALGFVLVLLAVRSLTRARVWSSNDVFFAQLIEDAPNSFRSHWAIGYFALESGDSALGEQELLTAVGLNPEHPQLLEDFGRLYASTGRYEPAIPLLSHAVSIDSTRLSAALPLALSLARLGRTQEALAVVDNMTRVHGETRGILLVRGEVLMRGRHFARAVEVLMELIGREPNVWSVRLMAAEAAFEAGRCEFALAQTDTALSLAPEAEEATVIAFRSRVANGNANCK